MGSWGLKMFSSWYLTSIVVTAEIFYSDSLNCEHFKILLFILFTVNHLTNILYGHISEWRQGKANLGPGENTLCVGGRKSQAAAASCMIRPAVQASEGSFSFFSTKPTLYIWVCMNCTDLFAVEHTLFQCLCLSEVVFDIKRHWQRVVKQDLLCITEIKIFI